MNLAKTSVRVENLGDYCLGRAQDRIESFDTCMRNAEEASDHNLTILTFLIIAIILAVVLYNRAQAKKAEATAAGLERERRQALTPEQRIAEDVAEAEAGALQREQARADAEALESARRIWSSGFFLPGIPLPPEQSHPSRPKPPGDAPPGWYDSPTGDGYGLYFYQKYPFQYWDGARWVENTSPLAQHYYWSRR